MSMTKLFRSMVAGSILTLSVSMLCLSAQCEEAPLPDFEEAAQEEYLADEDYNISYYSENNAENVAAADEAAADEAFPDYAAATEDTQGFEAGYDEAQMPDLIVDAEAEVSAEVEETAVEDTNLYYVDSTSGTTGNASWEILTEGDVTLKITGSGATGEYANAGDVPWSSYLGQIKVISIDAGITAIGNNTLTGCTNAAVIKGYFGSAAETYAKANSLRFEPLETADISKASASLSADRFDYSGNACTPDVTVVYSVTALVKDTDYTVAYNNNVNAGTASVIITGKGNYNGILTKTFTIAPVSLESAAVSGIAAKRYTGSEVAQTPSVVLGGRTLAGGIDYSLSYQNNVKVGKNAKVIITGIGNYTGSITKTFVINKTLLKKVKVTNIKAKIYTGKRIKQNPVLIVDGVVLKQGRDYKITYKNNVNIGKATMIIKGKGGVKGKIRRTFKIRKASIKEASITNVVNKTFTGKALTQSPKVVIGGRTLRAGSDYKLSYRNNVKVGTATVIIKGSRNYKGSRSMTFNIEKADIKNASVTGVTDKGYTGKAVTQDPVIKLAGVTLKQGRDYSLSYKNNVNFGTAEMTITGIGNYKGERRFTFKIKILPISNASVSGIEDLVYTGGPVVQSPSSLTVKLDNDKLVNGKDYRVTYQNNYNVGTATMIIIGIGSYNGSITKTFSINPKGTTLQSAYIANKRLNMRWTAQTQASDGYQLQYSTDPKFENKTATKSAKIVGSATDHTSYPIVNETASYYVRIRIYKTINGRTYFSPWSNILTSRRQ